MNIQLIIMIYDIDKKNSNYKPMNILQLKWMLYILIQKKYYNKLFKLIQNLIIEIFIYL